MILSLKTFFSVLALALLGFTSTLVVAQTSPLLELPGQLDGAVLQYRFNANDPNAGGVDTITIAYRIPTVGWAGFAFSRDAFMPESEAVIGVPATGEVLKYNLNSRSGPGVVPMPAQQQTLIDASITVDEAASTTTLVFTKIMSEAGEIPILAGVNTFLGAWAPTLELGIHSIRQPFGIDLLTAQIQDAGQAVAPPPTVPPQQPTNVPAPVPVPAPIPAPIPAPGGAVAITSDLLQLPGQLDGAVMQYRVTPNDPNAGGQDTITIAYRIPTVGWAGIAFSTDTSMPGSEAVIGVPATGEVLKYNLNSRSGPGVVPMPAQQQTLIDASITVDEAASTTTMAFTKIMSEAGEIPIISGVNTFLGAWAPTLDLSIHSKRQPFFIDLVAGELQDDGQGAVPAADVPAPAPAPVSEDVPVVVDVDGFTSVAMSGQLADSAFQFRVNPNDPNAGGQDTVTVTYTVNRNSWLAIGWSDNGGSMIGSEAVIGLPDEGTVQKYNLNGKSVPGVVPFADAQQTLIDTSITQEGGITTMTFTKIMVEDGEIPLVLVGSNDFLGAFGSANTLATHSNRESFSLDLASGGVAQLETRKVSLWKAHGFFAGIAWGVLSPMAIGASVLRQMLPGAMFFTIHRALNMLVVLFTIAAFAIAVAAINQETPAGASPNHFNPKPYAHRLVGLVIFIVALVQAVMGIFRPHNPDVSKGEVKGLMRKLWEVAHKVLGYSCLGMALYQVQSGIKLYQSFFGGAENMLAVFWALAAGICGFVVFGFIGIKITGYSNKSGKEAMPEQPFSSSASATAVPPNYVGRLDPHAVGDDVESPSVY